MRHRLRSCRGRNTAGDRRKDVRVFAGLSSVHDRAFAGSDISAVHVLCTVETRYHEHLGELRAQLKSHGVETYDSK
jgi:hypothetical protein